MRCGRAGMESPLQFIVPGMRQMRAGLYTVKSTLTASDEAFAISVTACCTTPPSSAGRSMR